MDIKEMIEKVDPQFVSLVNERVITIVERFQEQARESGSDSELRALDPKNLESVMEYLAGQSVVGCPCPTHTSAGLLAAATAVMIERISREGDLNEEQTTILADNLVRLFIASEHSLFSARDSSETPRTGNPLLDALMGAMGGSQPGVEDGIVEVPMGADGKPDLSSLSPELQEKLQAGIDSGEMVPLPARGGLRGLLGR